MTVMDTRQLHCLALSTFLLVPLSAYPQTTLTGAMWMATTSSGTTSVCTGLRGRCSEYAWKRPMVGLVAGTESGCHPADQWPVRHSSEHFHPIGGGQEL